MLTRSRLAATLSATLAAGALVLTAAVAIAPPATAAARISATNDEGTSVAATSRATTFTLRGSGFQSIKGGFGGVYVAFGWVRDPAGGGWRPSKGGITGRDYRYVPDSESEDNAGYLRFVAFPGSSTAGEAQAVMSASGAFSVSLTVPGPTFQSLDRNGDAVDVDCRQVTCGVITFGAHGVKNAGNETFTPIRFEEPDDDSATAGADEGATTGEQPSDAGPSTTTQAPPTGSSGTTAKGGSTVRRGKPSVRTERATARAGRALAFTGTGFEPGEQVLALLDDGEVALGPLVAGNAGEVAGVMALPAELGTGTHQLRLIGAASGARPSERFPVRAAGTTAVLDTEPAAATQERDVVALAFVGVAALALLAAVAHLLLRLRRRARRTTPAATRREVTA